MLFNSYEFIFFFVPVTIGLFFGIARWISHSAATLWLVLASFFFYGWWDWHYVPLLFGSICWNYLIGKRIENSQDSKKSWLTLGLVVNVLLLGYYKYTGFFLQTANDIAGSAVFDIPSIVLPLGISFFTFTQSGYLVDAYRGQTKNDSFLTYCEFVTIFPHLIAGPIIVHKDMIPQFIAAETFKINYDNMAKGLTLFTIGLMKKVVLADKIAPWVWDAFSRTDNLTMAEAWVGSIGYAMQLYFDFSAYSEMAIGLGLMLNLKFPVNFDSPYKATSVIDLWRRWHMTLGVWLRDYLYIPMGGGRKGPARKIINLFISMLIIGFWHGAGWTYIIWGAMQGIFLAINHVWRIFNMSMPRLLGWVLTFSSFIISLMFFRADNYVGAINILSCMVDFNNIMPAVDQSRIMYELRFVFIALFVSLIVPNPVRLMKYFKPNLLWFIITMLAMMFTLKDFANVSDFLYFQF